MDIEKELLGFEVIEPDRKPGKAEKYKPILRKQQEFYEAKERANAVYAEHQNNKKKAGNLRTDILKGLQQGENSYILLLKAMECISIMTGDSAFYLQGKEEVKSVYGIGFEHDKALQIELKELKERLHMLSRPELQNEPENSRKRINNAIKQHKEKIAKLEQLKN